jgi:hypothetical protein
VVVVGTDEVVDAGAGAVVPASGADVDAGALGDGGAPVLGVDLVVDGGEGAVVASGDVVVVGE